MYRIIIDSCGDLTPELKKNDHFVSVPLELEVSGVRIVDDETFDQKDFLKRVAESENGPKSSCPSPEAYMSQFDCDAENIYVITLSAELSGSYNSARLAVELYEENEEGKNIHVFNSKSASIGQTLIALKIRDCEEAGMSFEETIATVDKYIEEQHTFFVLETLETLRKNGRLSNLKAFVAETLNIKPVMGSTDVGSIQQLGKTRGMQKALKKMVEEMLSVTKDTENKVLAIAHCNAYDKAEAVAREVKKLSHFKSVIIVDTAGVSSMYASDGGIIMAV